MMGKAFRYGGMFVCFPSHKLGPILLFPSADLASSHSKHIRSPAYNPSRSPSLRPFKYCLLEYLNHGFQNLDLSCDETRAFPLRPTFFRDIHQPRSFPNEH